MHCVKSTSPKCYRLVSVLILEEVRSFEIRTTALIPQIPSRMVGAVDIVRI